jgi:hypothetical protein
MALARIGQAEAEANVLMARARLEAAKLRLVRLERLLKEADERGDQSPEEGRAASGGDGVRDK